MLVYNKGSEKGMNLRSGNLLFLIVLICCQLKNFKNDNKLIVENSSIKQVVAGENNNGIGWILSRTGYKKYCCCSLKKQ